MGSDEILEKGVAFGFIVQGSRFKVRFTSSRFGSRFLVRFNPNAEPDPEP
jgi:hypothetical protein